MSGRDNIVRTAYAQDESALKALWRAVFGDDPADIDHFFETYFSPELTAVIDEDKTPVSAAYILPVGRLVRPGRTPVDCAMIYAVATQPACRGRGYGEAVTGAAGNLAVKRGFPAVVLKPADDGLFDFYGQRSDFREFFDVYEYRYRPSALPAPTLTAAPATPEAYRALRRHFLDGTVYIDMDERGLAYQQYLCAASGGGLYALSDGGRDAGCAIVEPDGPAVHVKELLLDSDRRPKDAVSALAAHFPAAEYAVRTTSPCAVTPPTGKKRFGMLLANADLENGAAHNMKWYGPAFD
ncbi:Acetyltransferase (GNAT) domain-containing protein [Sporobacter termitidis DSM 10068]|uniref:Acetyltransferase (GNAT) domain-containing protein n=2 Tax=Sporobacter TaxID=44748 RepID=A0A1M5VIT6_9FIRM|nr:Acetyltransferase (GNAT) domain-containing protein [Sporobacter termitidis DSM 10068]